jgi:hypothetical protein
MPLTFDEAEQLFRNDNIRELSVLDDGIRFLKLRSLSRRDGLERLFASVHTEIPLGNTQQAFRTAYSSRISVQDIEACIRVLYTEERAVRRQHEPELINQLYRLQEFNWGGLHQNSLEKTIVDNYVKKIRNYDRLNELIEGDLHVSMRGYVLCSWYNHWTSIIIEDIFKDHPNVLPAVGLVKKIDFFIRDVPFDLKVTYLPEGYLARKRQQSGERPELTLLKQTARQYRVPVPTDLSSGALLQDLWAKLIDHPEPNCQFVVRQLHGFRNALVSRIQEEPTDLIRWLYEEQGLRRFDASNRLFLVLVDERSYFDSWKLKRAKAQLEAKITHYLDSVGEAIGRGIEFQWQGKTHRAISDLLVVTNAGMQ